MIPNTIPFAALLRETKFVVEANDYERLSLWQSHHEEMDWVQIQEGHIVRVGQLAGFPVNIGLFWARLDGALVMFVDTISRVVDIEMIDGWLKKNCNPYWDRGWRRAHTNAMNFHHVLEYVRNPDRR